MQSVTVRPAEPRDALLYADWLLKAADINLMDAGVYRYPTCTSLVVDRGDEPVLMNSFQAAIVMEALAPKPGVSPMTEARSLKALFDGVKRIAAATGVREMYFGCADPRVEKIVQRHGWEKLNFPMFRARLENQ